MYILSSTVALPQVSHSKKKSEKVKFKVWKKMDFRPDMRDETRRGHADRDGCAVSVLVTFCCVFFSSDFCVFLSFVFCGEKLMRLQ